MSVVWSRWVLVVALLGHALCCLAKNRELVAGQKKWRFPFGEEKLVAPLIAVPNVDKANRRQEKGKKLN